MHAVHKPMLIGILLLLALNITVVSAQETPETTIAPLFVAAVGGQKSTWSIVMLDPATDGPQYLTDDSLDEISPIASPDARYVVFQQGDFTTEIPFEYYILDRQCLPECQPRPLPAEVNEMRDLRWSPVTPQLVAWGKDNAAWLIDIPSNSVQQIIGGKWNAEPSWSPDGSVIVVSSDVVPEDDMLSDDIQIVPARPNQDDSIRINLTYSGLFVEEVDPHFSPDGLYIAYRTRTLVPDTGDKFASSPFGLLTIEADCVIQLSTCLDTRILRSSEGQEVHQYSWSPNGRFIAYRTGSETDNDQLGDLWVVSVETGLVTQLTEGETTGTFTWAPDSTTIAYEHVSDSIFDVYLAFLDGRREPGPVLSGFRGSATPYWSYE
ncbi:MAG: hypothetical protein LCI00_33350 [Chloroflexi bacterium]|nr:hypothetical protein [Chloroflexota bacterium]MCC6897097.1 PD40 domain-containing protein [Anaerolineae bacterium]